MDKWMKDRDPITGREYFWNGHLCEGTRLVDFDSGTFCLWTRCGKHDVPANAAWLRGPDDVLACAECDGILHNTI